MNISSALLCRGFIFVCLLLPYLSSADDKLIKITSLEWPPYTASGLPEQGMSALVAKKAFAAMGYKLEISFYPWQRAVNMAKADSAYMGYFPEYYSKDTEKAFVFSESMGISPLGFAENKSKPIVWNSLEDLKNMAIGTVSGYVNTEAFDQMAISGELSVKPVVSDDKNLLKLGGKRIDLAVIDKNVMVYLLKNEKSLASVSGQLAFNSKLLEEKGLYICFKKTAEGEKLAKIYNEGLKKIDVEGIMKSYSY